MAPRWAAIPFPALEQKLEVTEVVVARLLLQVFDSRTRKIRIEGTRV
jgi:hypothetical protein